MGMLYNQTPREHKEVSYNELEFFLDKVIDLAKKKKVSIDNVLLASKILEIKRTNNLYVRNGDVDDEKMMGIGEELRAISNAIENITSKVGK